MRCMRFTLLLCSLGLAVSCGGESGKQNDSGSSGARSDSGSGGSVGGAGGLSETSGLGGMGGATGGSSGATGGDAAGGGGGGPGGGTNGGGTGGAAGAPDSSTGGSQSGGSGGSPSDGGATSGGAGGSAGSLSVGGATSGGAGGSAGDLDGGTSGGGADVAGGAGGGTTGGSGGDATGGTSGTGGTGGIAVECSATLVPPVAPVVVAATLSCDGVIEQVSVAAGAATSGFVSLGATYGTTPSFFFDISPSVADVELIQPDALEIRMATNAAGALAVVETLRGSGTALWLTRAPAGTAPAWESSTITDTMWPSSTIDCAIGPDGAQHATFLQDPGAYLGLATRPANGSTFATATVSPTTTVSESVLTVDADGVPHVLYWIPERGLVDSQPGLALVTALAATGNAWPTLMQGVRPSGVGVAVSLALEDGLHVVRQRADSAFDDIPIPATLPPPPVLSLSYSCSTPGICPTQTQLGDFARGGALAEASDGTLWLATVRDHVDRTASYQTVVSGVCQCSANLALSDDRSTSALVIQAIAPDSTAPSSILWSHDLGLTPWTYFSVRSTTMSASFLGSLLYLAILGVDGDVHYFVVDTAGLQ